MALEDVEKVLNEYTQWKYMTARGTSPEDYVKFLAREGALEKLESVIMMLDDMVERWAGDLVVYAARDEPSDRAVVEYIKQQQGFMTEDRERAGI